MAGPKKTMCIDIQGLISNQIDKKQLFNIQRIY